MRLPFRHTGKEIERNLRPRNLCFQPRKAPARWKVPDLPRYLTTGMYYERVEVIGKTI